MQTVQPKGHYQDRDRSAFRACVENTVTYETHVVVVHSEFYTRSFIAKLLAVNQLDCKTNEITATYHPQAEAPPKAKGDNLQIRSIHDDRHVN